MVREHLEDFDQPWCKAFFESTEYQEVHDERVSREHPPNKEAGTQNSFIAKTLATEDTIRALVMFYRPASEKHGAAEVCFMISVGTGMNGHAGVMHGGMVYSLLDEVQGMACNDLAGRGGLMTGTMVVRYRKYIATPCLLLCRARLTGQEGRKVYTKATIEDGKGGLHTECDGTFILLKKNMKL